MLFSASLTQTSQKPTNQLRKTKNFDKSVWIILCEISLGN